MSKNAIEVLFESRARVKILKFLFRNMTKNYTFAEIVNHVQEDASVVRREINKLEEINLIHEKAKEKSA